MKQTKQSKENAALKLRVQELEARVAALKKVGPKTLKEATTCFCVDLGLKQMVCAALNDQEEVVCIAHNVDLVSATGLVKALEMRNRLNLIEVMRAKPSAKTEVPRNAGD